MADSVRDKVLRSFVIRLKGTDAVPDTIIDALSELFAKGDKVSADDVVEAISTRVQDATEGES